MTTTQTFDLSKLKRRQPDMKNIKKPRFLFPGWELRYKDNLVVTLPPQESEFTKNSDKLCIVLPRENGYELRIQWDHGEPGWVLSGPKVNKDRNLVVWVIKSASYEEIIRATEAAIMRAFSEGGSRDLGILIPFDGHWKNFQPYAEECLAQWRKLEAQH